VLIKDIRTYVIVFIGFLLSSCSLYSFYSFSLQENTNGHAVVAKGKLQSIRSYSVFEKSNIVTKVDSKLYSHFKVANDEMIITIKVSSKTLACIQSDIKNKNLLNVLSRSIPSQNIFNVTKAINVEMTYLDEREFDLSEDYIALARFYFPHRFCHGGKFQVEFINNISRIYHEVTHLLQRDAELLSMEIEASSVGLCAKLLTPTVKGYKFNLETISNNSEEILNGYNENKLLSPIHYYSELGSIEAEKRIGKYFPLNEIDKNRDLPQIKKICAGIFNYSIFDI